MNIDELENKLKEECPNEARSCVGRDAGLLALVDGTVYEIHHVELDPEDGRVYLRLEE